MRSSLQSMVWVRKRTRPRLERERSADAEGVLSLSTSVSRARTCFQVDGKGNFIKKMSKDQPVDLDPSVMDDEAKNKAGISSAKLWKRINPGWSASSRMPFRCAGPRFTEETLTLSLSLSLSIYLSISISLPTQSMTGYMDLPNSTYSRNFK